MNLGGRTSVMKHPVVVLPGVVKPGMVEGKKVEDILQDTGCSRTMVHQKLVAKEKIQDADVVTIRCAHGDIVLYPLTKVSLVVEGRPIEIEAAVSDTLPLSMLLGTDCSVLPELLQDGGRKAKGVFAVTTRDARKKQEEGDEDCGVQPRAIDENEEVWMKELDADLFSGGKTKQKQTRKEKREKRRRRSQLQSIVEEDAPDCDEGLRMKGDRRNGVEKHKLEISSEELRNLQALDSTLGELRRTVKGCEPTEGVFYKDGLQFRRWIPYGRDKEMVVKQLVLGNSMKSETKRQNLKTSII